VKQKLNSIVIIGTGGHATSVLSVAISAGYTIKCFVDKNKKCLSFLGFNIVNDILELESFFTYNFAIAVGDNASRERIYNQLKQNYPNLKFPSLISSAASICSFSNIKEGTVVMPKAVIGSNTKIGQFCLINTGSSIDHDCVMSDFSYLAPAAATGGNVKIGMRSAISIGAVIKHGIKIGNDCVIGANSYLNKDLPHNKVAYGVPARQVRNRNIGDPYL
jgi:sugar O-acyltransferase (sialic acid O-acetyltransferase NeuD family)